MSDDEGKLYETLWGDVAPLPVEATKPIPLTPQDKAALAELRREQARKREHERRKAGNPLIAKFGPGPDGKTCGRCAHLREKRYAGTYFKCDLRRNSNGPGTDHRKKWLACGRYEPHQA